jgi:hypothetical protein
MSVEAAAQDRVKCLLTIKRTSAHHRVKPPLTITEMRTEGAQCFEWFYFVLWR